jgi:hypothetical protein
LPTRKKIDLIEASSAFGQIAQFLLSPRVDIRWNGSITRSIAAMAPVFHLDPVLAATAAIGPSAVLGDQALQSHPAGREE